MMVTDSFVAGLRSQDLQRWVHQARLRSFDEARAVALQGEACFCAEEDQGYVHAVGAWSEGREGSPSASRNQTPDTDARTHPVVAGGWGGGGAHGNPEV